MRDPWADAELARHFENLVQTSLPRAPLNSALSAVIARHRSLSTLLGHAPPTQQTPVLLLAAIHHLLIGAPDEDLARWYPNLSSHHRTPDDPDLERTLIDFVDDHTPQILELLETRRVQTNEVGRCALFVPVFAEIERSTGPLGHIDIGSSAGLTTLTPHYGFRYDGGAVLGEPELVIDCSTRGDRPTPAALPTIRSARGLDPSPLSATDPDDARWLAACCWPDQTDRFARLTAALAIARRHPPELHIGDAVDGLEPLVRQAIAEHAHPMITTSWVLNYLPPDRQSAFVEAVDRLGARFDLSWLAAESPAQTPVLDHAPDVAGTHTTSLISLTWRGGQRTVQHLGVAHPHGYWIHWR